MTLGTAASAQASTVLPVRSSSSAWNCLLLNPRMNGAPGMPLGAMAQVRPYFLRVGQWAGSMISTDAQPRSRAARHVLSASHFSPRALKHQNTTDCLTRPLRIGVGSWAAVASGGCKPAVPTAAAIVPFRTWRRFIGRTPGEVGFGGEYTRRGSGRRQPISRLGDLAGGRGDGRRPGEPQDVHHAVVPDDNQGPAVGVV